MAAIFLIVSLDFLCTGLMISSLSLSSMKTVPDFSRPSMSLMLFGMTIRPNLSILAISCTMGILLDWVFMVCGDVWGLVGR